MSKRRMARRGGLVYSTDPREKSRIDDSAKASRAGKAGRADAPSQGVRVWRQTKGRKGKGVTLVKGLTQTSSELVELAGKLKKLCGSGGTVKDGVIEIQGDHRDKVVDYLLKQGIQAKKAGG